MNSTWDWYSTNRKGHRKKEIVKAFIIYFILCMLLVDILALFEFLLPYLVMQKHPKFRFCMRFL